MNDILENHQKEKTIKSINLDDFSIEDLNHYLNELKGEIERVKSEKEKKSQIIDEAHNFFK